MIPIAPAFKIDDRWDTVLSFARQLSKIWTAGNGESWHLDLRSCAYLGPNAATLVAATYLSARQRGQTCQVDLPDSPTELAAFCAFSGLNHMLFGGARPKPDHPDCETVPLSQFYQAMGNAGAPIIALVERHVGELTTDTQTYLHMAYQEVVQNIQDHADSPIGGVSCARCFSGTREVRVAVVDTGIGIHVSLSRRFPELGPVESLRSVFAGGYTSQSLSRNMGQGISNLAQVVANHAGELIVYSGNAVGIRQPNVAEDYFDRVDASFPGTAIFFKMKLPR